MRLLIDENVPERVAEVFAARGHEVLYSRIVFATHSPDQLLALGAAMEGLVIVTHDKDLKRFSKTLPQGYHAIGRPKHHGRIHISGHNHLAAARIEELLPTIETLFQLVERRRRQFIILVKHTGIELIDNAVKP